MSVELHADEGVETAASTTEPVIGSPPRDGRRPNVSGDLPTLFRAGPMFRRTLAGYDRFQVDTYVQWAEDELATADREHEDLLARQLRTQAALDEARQLLAHSSGGGEFLRLSPRLGAMLAAAADEAEGIRAEADADRCAASAQAERMVAQAQRVIADARTEAAQMVAAATTEVATMTAEAHRIVAEAEATDRRTRADAAARLEKAQVIEQRAIEQAQEIRRQAREEATAARLQARDEIGRMLSTGRDERRRADDEAAAYRARLDRDAATRSAALRAEVAALERRRAALRAEVERPAVPAGGATRDRPDVHLRRVLDRFRRRTRALRTP